MTITLSDSVLENLEKMAKEMGLSKSAMISGCSRKLQERSSKIKKAELAGGAFGYIILGLIIPYGKRKARYFTFLLYPDSIPEDWEMRLELIGVLIAVSPLHDKDLSDIEGQLYKKAHYHVIYVAKIL